MNYEKFLPLGTVVMLKGGKKRLMITGYYMSSNDDRSKLFDYTGVLYPEGMISTEQTPLFNHDQIETIYNIGFSDDEDKQFKIKLKELIAQDKSVLNNTVSDLPIAAQQSANTENSNISQ